MLKGRTRIELTNVNTGEKEIHEDTNMFTNNIDNGLNNGWTQAVGGLTTIRNWHLPICEKMLGGVALFEDTITEDADITYFPEGNKVVGYAGDIASSGTALLCGSRNHLESVPYDPETKSVKYVWDFATSEGNGTISSIGLMPAKQPNYYGESLWNVEYDNTADASGIFQAEVTSQVVLFEGDNIAWFDSGTGQTTLHEGTINLDTVTLDTELAAVENKTSTVISLPNETIDYTYMTWKDGDDGYWYGFMGFTSSAFTNKVSSVNTASYYLQVIRVDKETYAMTYHNLTIPDYYVCYNHSSPLVTDNYILLGVSTIARWDDYSEYIRKDKLCFIDKSDWSVAVADIVDAEGIACSFCPDDYTGTVCGRYEGILEPIYAIKLPNGMYQWNDLLLDDDGVVLQKMPLPVDKATRVPLVSVTTSATLRAFPVPYDLSLNAYSYIYSMVINKEKRLVLWSSNNTSYRRYIAPLNCQSLATINNLETPITKTDVQTMKIVYTVTDAEPEV